MKPLLVFARIIIVGCLWSIVFIEGIRVIMLCNWHFDIFWGDHWRQFFDLWKAGWEIDAPKEWAFILILLTFFPMLITGWWTLCLVAWEDIVRDILLLPYRIYQYFIKAPINVITTNNKYGVTKKKSYKQIRPVGVGKIYTPISDYGAEGSVSIPPAVAKASGYPSATPALQYTPAQSFTSAMNRTAQKVKTDIPATIDHALFKFDDGDDDFDLDIDSFEKTDFSKPEKRKEPARASYFEDDDYEEVSEPSGRKNEHRSKPTFDFDDEAESEANENGKNYRQNREKRNNDSDKKREQKKSRQTQNRDNRDARDNRENRGNYNETPHKNDNDGKDVSRNPVYETLQQKGYDIVTNISVGGTAFDFVGHRSLPVPD